MSKRIPPIMFDVDDWLIDEKLSLCSPSTRGIYMDILCAMHKQRCAAIRRLDGLDRPHSQGELTGTAQQISRVCRCSDGELAEALDELGFTKTAQVSCRKNVYTIINRRMKREGQKHKASKQRYLRYKEKRKNNAQKTLAQRSRNALESSTSTKANNTAHTNTNPKDQIGFAKCAQNVLALDLALAEKKKVLCQTLNRLFFPNKVEAKTFANIVAYLVRQVQFEGKPLTLLDDAVAWARRAKEATGVRNPKGLFVNKVKQATGYKRSSKLMDG